MPTRLPRSCATAAIVAAALSVVAAPVSAADKVKVGFVSTLSGPSSALGVDIRDGFLLAVKLAGGKLGGLPAEVLVSDDQFKPDVAKQLFEKNIKRDKVDFMTGVVFSNIMLAALPEALDSKTIYISPNAAPSSIAGKDCNPLFFAVSWPNDAYHEAAGQFANTRDLKSVYLVAPNYQAGKDSLAGFKRTFKGQIVGENYTKLGQLVKARDVFRTGAGSIAKSASPTPPSSPRSAPPGRRRSTSSCPAAWASTSSNSTSVPASARTRHCCCRASRPTRT